MNSMNTYMRINVDLSKGINMNISVDVVFIVT